MKETPDVDHAEAKQRVIKEYATKEGDTGSPEVQVAILTSRITDADRALQDPRQGQPFPARPAQDGLPAPQAARLRQEPRRAALPGADRRLGIRR
jgi:hypothetical protein